MIVRTNQFEFFKAVIHSLESIVQIRNEKFVADMAALVKRPESQRKVREAEAGRHPSLRGLLASGLPLLSASNSEDFRKKQAKYESVLEQRI
jgi:hypothetical protein